jgi:hypothetical protein
MWALLKRLHTPPKGKLVSPYLLALIHVGLGESAKAIRCLQKAYEKKCDWLMHAGVEPRWDPVRSSEDFRELLRKLRLPSVYGLPVGAATDEANQ